MDDCKKIEIYEKMITEMAEMYSGSDLYEHLSGLGLTDDEILEAGFSSLRCYIRTGYAMVHSACGKIISLTLNDKYNQLKETAEKKYGPLTKVPSTDEICIFEMFRDNTTELIYSNIGSEEKPHGSNEDNAKESMHSYWEEIRDDYIQNGDSLDPEEDLGIKESITIDAWKPNHEDGTVIARVILTVSNDIVVIYNDQIARSDKYAQEIIHAAIGKLETIKKEDGDKENPTVLLLENASNIGITAGVMIASGEIAVESQINLAKDITYGARLFEKEFEKHCNDPDYDYFIAIDQYAKKWLKNTYPKTKE